jgi:hypothetical protein
MPIIDLLDFTSIEVTPALSYVTLMVLTPAPALPFVHLLVLALMQRATLLSAYHDAWSMASCPPAPGHLFEAGRQPFSEAVPSLPMKLYLFEVLGY